MRRAARFPLAMPGAAIVLSRPAGCTGNIIDPTPTLTLTPMAGHRACPTTIPDQPTNQCSRLKNLYLTCGGDGMLHSSVSGGSGSAITLGASLDEGSVLSAVLAVANCQGGPREGVTYSGQASTPAFGPPCISQSKTVYSQFRFGNPLYAGFEGLAKGKLHETLDEQALSAFVDQVGLAKPATPRCSFWRQFP